jgi:Zn-dependent protease
MQLEEFRDLSVSAIILAAAFAYPGFAEIDKFITMLPFALLTVSVAFVGHELAHRYFARKYGCYAVYRAWPLGLALALLLAIATNGNFVFAAPGAVMIYPMIDLWGNVRHLDKRKMGIVSVAGPITNICLALAFLAAGIFTGFDLLLFGASINAWLAVFNLIPLGPLDGTKIWHWDKRIWAAALALSVGLFVTTIVI